MGDVRLICLDADDLMHENTGESNYNESAYYNFYDPRRGSAASPASAIGRTRATPR